MIDAAGKMVPIIAENHPTRSEDIPMAVVVPKSYDLAVSVCDSVVMERISSPRENGIIVSVSEDRSIWKITVD